MFEVFISRKRCYSKIFKKKGFTNHQCQYVRDIMLTSWLKREKKIEKNDIFDMLCVGILDYKCNIKAANILVDTTSYLISFDSTMENYLLNAHPHSYKILSSLKLK